MSRELYMPNNVLQKCEKSYCVDNVGVTDRRTPLTTIPLWPYRAERWKQQPKPKRWSL